MPKWVSPNLFRVRVARNFQLRIEVAQHRTSPPPIKVWRDPTLTIGLDSDIGLSSADPNPGLS